MLTEQYDLHVRAWMFERLLRDVVADWPRNTPNLERRALALRLRREGLTLREIGEHLGVSQTRADQLIWRGYRDEMRANGLDPDKHQVRQAMRAETWPPIKRQRSWWYKRDHAR
jgi:hypothetical protein